MAAITNHHTHSGLNCAFILLQVWRTEHKMGGQAALLAEALGENPFSLPLPRRRSWLLLLLQHHLSPLLPLSPPLSPSLTLPPLIRTPVVTLGLP